MNAAISDSEGYNHDPLGLRRVLAPDTLLRQEGITQRQWRARKRTELRQVAMALNVYTFGSAFCPGSHPAVEKIRGLLEQLKEAHATKNWH